MYPSADAEEPVKERLQLFDDCLLFRGPVAAAKAGGGRHDAVNVGAGGFDFAVPEGVFDESARLRIFQFFILYDRGKLFFTFGGYKLLKALSVRRVCPAESVVYIAPDVFPFGIGLDLFHVLPDLQLNGNRLVDVVGGNAAVKNPLAWKESILLADYTGDI